MSKVLNRAMIDSQDKRLRTNLINCLSGFKGANLLGSINAKGKTNLAIMTSVFHVGANPPSMGCLFRPHTVPRHTLENINEMGCFTLNAVTKTIYAQAHQTGARYPRDQSEFDAVGLTPEYSDIVNAPYVAESPVQIGLTLVETHTLKINGTVLVVGEINEIRLADGMIAEDGQLNLSDFNVVTISGLDEYLIPESLGRLPYPKT